MSLDGLQGYTQGLIAILNLAVWKSEYDDSLLLKKEINLTPALSHLLHLEVPLRYQLYSLSIERYLTIDIWGHFGKKLKGFWLVFILAYGVGQDEQPELHPGVAVSLRTLPVQLWFVVLWLNNSWNFNISQEFSPKILTSSTPTRTFSSQTIPMVKVRCLHKLRGVMYHYESVPVPPMPPGVPTRNLVMPVCHMAQELYAMVELCVLIFMWWPRGCGWNSRLSLQSMDYPCSLRLHCVCKNFTKY